MRVILVLLCCFQTTIYLACTETYLIWGSYHLSNCSLLYYWLSAHSSHSMKTLGDPNSYLHLHSNNFQQLQCAGIDTDLNDTKSLLILWLCRSSSHLQWLAFLLPFSHWFPWSSLGLDIIQTMKSQKPESLLWLPPPALPAHLLKCAL